METSAALDVAAEALFSALGRLASQARRRLPQLEELLGIAVEDFLEVGLWKLQRLDHPDRLAHVHRALLRIERRVRGEHGPVGAEELEAADGGRARAEDCGIRVELPEVVERPLPELERRLVESGRARAELVEAWADASLEERDHRPIVVGADLAVRMPVEKARERDARHRDTRLVRPAESPPHLVLRLLLGEVVGNISATC